MDDYVFNASEINVNQEWVSMTDFSLHNVRLRCLFFLNCNIKFIS